MNKIIAICFLSFFLIGGLAAQDEKNDPKATRILDQVKAKYDEYLSLEADVKLTMEIPESEAEVINGKMVQSGDKYRIEMGNHIVLCDGKNLWTVMKQNEIVQLSDAKSIEETEGNMMMSPKDLMKIYENGTHIYALTSESKEKGRTVQQIEFKPIDEDAEYFKMRLTIDKANKTVNRMKIFSRDGSRYTLEIKGIKANKAYNSSYFQYDESICPDCEVEDIRID